MADHQQRLRPGAAQHSQKQCLGPHLHGRWRRGGRYTGAPHSPGPGPHLRVLMSLPLLVSHILQVLSMEPVATTVPS